MANGNFGGGSGTTKSPFLVEDAEDLQAISRNFEGGSTLYYKQVKNIDLGGINWIPINFSGGFDGNDFEISNLKITNIETENNSIGLFGSVGGFGNFKGYLMNIKLTNVDIVGGNAWCGGIVGLSNCDFIYNCTVDGRVRQNGGGATGGIAGAGKDGSLISYCKSDVDFSSDDSDYTYFIGGIVGSFNGTIEKSKSIMKLKRQSDYNDVGGIAGHFSGGEMKECEADVNIEGSTGHTIGGLIGITSGRLEIVKVTDCFATGNIEAHYYIGGLIGNMNTQEVQVNRCYSTINIVIREWAGGGLFGMGGSGWKRINDCFILSNGLKVTGSSNAYGDVVGQRLLNVSQFVVTNVFKLDTFTIDKGTNTAEPVLKASGTINSSKASDKSTYAGWDFMSVWEMSNLPILKLEKPEKPPLPPVPSPVIAKCTRISLSGRR